jgi:hypothetical protein
MLEFRERDPNKFLVAVGDFNGDGIEDRAVLLLNDANTKLALFVCLTTVSGCEWHRLQVVSVRPCRNGNCHCKDRNIRDPVRHWRLEVPG